MQTELSPPISIPSKILKLEAVEILETISYSSIGFLPFNRQRTENFNKVNKLANEEKSLSAGIVRAEIFCPRRNCRGGMNLIKIPT